METPPDGDFGEVERETPFGVVEYELDLGNPMGRPSARPGEDDFLHLLGPEVLGALSTEHPGDGVDHVGLPGAVGADHDGHPGFQFESRSVRERLEAVNLEGLEEQGRARLLSPGAIRMPIV